MMMKGMGEVRIVENERERRKDVLEENDGE